MRRERGLIVQLVDLVGQSIFEFSVVVFEFFKMCHNVYRLVSRNRVRMSGCGDTPIDSRNDTCPARLARQHSRRIHAIRLFVECVSVTRHYYYCCMHLPRLSRTIGCTRYIGLQHWNLEDIPSSDWFRPGHDASRPIDSRRDVRLARHTSFASAAAPSKGPWCTCASSICRSRTTRSIAGQVGHNQPVLSRVPE